jgi:hypothetical protein
MTTSIQLQQIGRVQAKTAAQFKIGDKMVWNFGHTTTVLGVASETKAFITYILKDDKNSSRHERRLKKTRLVAFL